MTFLVFAFCFMHAFYDWYYATYNFNGYLKDAKAEFVTDHILGMLIWWLSIYQLLEATVKPPVNIAANQPPNQHKNCLKFFSCLNISVIIGLFGTWNIIWICRGLGALPPTGMENGQNWMFWIYICANILVLVYLKPAGKDAYAHLNPNCLSEGKVTLLLILGLLILISRVLVSRATLFTQYWEATRFAWYLFTMINFLFAVRIANTRDLPGGSLLPHVMQPISGHYQVPVAGVVAGQQQPGIYYPPQQQPYAYVQQPS